MSKLLTVFGATGNQGGSLVRTVLSHPELSKTYKVRAVTRDPSKESAQALKDLGAEVVKGDQNDLESLKAATKGSYAVFAVTNFWEGMDGSAEERQGKAMADAAVSSGAEFFIFSSLPHTARVTNNKLTHIKHFEHKANVEEYVKTLPIKSAFYWPAFFMQNFASMFGPRKNDDGTFTLASTWNPDSKLPLIDISETGKYLVPLLKNPDAWNKKRMYAATAFYTPEQVVSALAKKTGKTINYYQMPDAELEKVLPPPIAKELTENMALMRDYLYFGPEGKGAEAELADSLATLEEKPTSWENFVNKTEWTNIQ